MRKLYLISIFNFFSYCVFSQIKVNSIIVDKSNNQPIPYVNIRIVGTSKGTNTDQEGYFKFDALRKNDSLEISSIGYSKKVISVAEVLDSIKLDREFIQLSAVTIFPQAHLKFTIHPEHLKKNNWFYVAKSEFVWALIHYEPFFEKYKSTPFIDNIQFYAKSKVKDAKIKIMLYESSNSNSLGTPLLQETIIYTIRKGHKINKLDLSEYSITFPTSGLLIAFEWIDVIENVYFQKTKNRENYVTEAYIQPSLTLINTSSASTIYKPTNGKLERVSLPNKGMAISISLTN